MSAIAYNNELSLSSVLTIAYLSSMEYYFKPIRVLAHCVILTWYAGGLFCLCMEIFVVIWLRYALSTGIIGKEDGDSTVGNKKKRGKA